MPTTAQQVFDLTMALIDELNETTGATDTDGTKAYKQRALPLLNVLRGELYAYSATCVRVAGARPVTPDISGFTAPIDLDDFLAQSVLPYGLAAQLLIEENPPSAGFFQQKYTGLLAKYGGAIPAQSEDITNLYGGPGYSAAGLW